MSFEQWCEERGLDPANLNDAARKSMQAAWKAEVAAQAGGGTATATATAGGGGAGNGTGNRGTGEATVDDVIAAARREDERRRRISELIAEAVQRLPDAGRTAGIESLEAIGRQAIEGKWTTERVELEILRWSRPSAGVVAAARYDRGPDDRTIEAAVCRGAGLDGLEDSYDEKTLTAMERHYPRGMSLCDMILHYARRGGYTGHSVRANPEAAMRAARRAHDVEAAGSWGPSTQGASIGSMLANVANKFFRAAFESVENSWREIAARRSANDFKQITTWSLTGDLTFKKLPPGGEIQHGQVDGTSYTNQVDTFARMLGLDRRDIINDDLGAFTSIARRLGRGGAIALNKLFWGAFLNNAAFFTAGRNNLITGAGTTLQLSQLDVLNQKFLLQTDPDGNILGVTPKILLVPPALAVTAQTLMSSTMLATGATTAPGTPSANVWAGKFRVVTSAYMQDSTLTGNSATSWYLLADPNDLPVIEVAFLNGQETPTVEEAPSDFGMLGQAFRGFFDIGVSMQEFRAGAKSAGA